jgi:hypothetical protein
MNKFESGSSKENGRKEIEEGIEEYRLTKEGHLQDLFENPEENVNELILILSDEYENSKDEPQFPANVENEAQSELCTVLSDVYKKIKPSLVSCYYLDNLKAYKAGKITKIPEMTVSDIPVIQMDISSRHVYEDTRSSDEIIMHVTNLIPYVLRDCENDNDCYYHEGHSNQFKFMVAEIARRIQNNELNLSDETVHESTDFLKETFRDNKNI